MGPKTYGRSLPKLSTKQYLSNRLTVLRPHYTVNVFASFEDTDTRSSVSILDALQGPLPDASIPGPLPGLSPVALPDALIIQVAFDCLIASEIARMSRSLG